MATNKRKRNYLISYSNVTQEKAEERLNIRFLDLINNSKRVEKLIEKTKISNIIEIKEKVYDRLIDRLLAEGYPESTISPYKEANVTDFVGDILTTIVSYFKRINNNNNIFIHREKEIISEDFETGGVEEFVIVDIISVTKTKNILIVEAKRENLIQGIKQCLLSLKDSWDTNKDNKPVYGLLTDGIDWRLIIYEPNDIQISSKFSALFEDMYTEKDEWINDKSKIVDVIYTVLENSIS